MLDKSQDIAPILKWAGGKRWFVSNHSKWLEIESKRYIEPFLGSGAVFFHLKPKKAILSDINEDLISTYKALKNVPEVVWEKLKYHQRMHCKDYYYLVRGQKPRSEANKAARFIYLNRTCFNGLYRVNLNGVFNVPKGTKNKVILPTDDFKKISKLLRNVKLEVCDFSTTIAKANEGDFLFVDPPYTVKHNNNNFLKYNENIFSWKDQKRLANDLKNAATRGVSIIMSNADHECIHELYSDIMWQKFSVTRHSVLASKAKFRRNTTEVVISNYLDLDGEILQPRN